MLLLNLINLLKKNKTKISQGRGTNIRIHKRNIPMSKEWYNSLYNFNKNTIRNLPSIYHNTYKLFSWYFNMTHNWIEKTQSHNYKKIPHSSDHKLWISNPEIKHFNDKINITIYIYNNTYNYYKNKLEFSEFGWGPFITEDEDQITLEEQRTEEKFLLLKWKYPFYLGENKTFYKSYFHFYQKMIKLLKLKRNIFMSLNKSYTLDVIKKNGNKELSKLLDNFEIRHYNYLINLYNKELLYLILKQKMLFHEFNYTEINLPIIIDWLQNIYKKKIDLNIVRLKYFWLSTSILLQMSKARIKDPNNRGIYLSPLDSVVNNVRMPILSKNKLVSNVKPYIGVQNVQLNKFDFPKTDYLNQFLLVNKRSKVWSDKNIDELVLSNLENKIVAGILLKITGRLTKRYKAQRAIKRLKFKGTLKNVYSAHKNYSSSLMRGYNSINVEKGTIASNVRVGAFGLTGWIASY